jgi:hypothetical protein
MGLDGRRNEKRLDRRSNDAATASDVDGRATARAVGTLAEGLFAETEGSAFLAGLAEFGAGIVGPVATLGAIIIPTPAGRVSRGEVPGDPALHYAFDEPAGVLRLYRDGEKGQETVVSAQMRSGGVLADRDTGRPVARLIDGKLVIDTDSLPELARDARALKGDDEPKLCPDPSEDVRHGASARAIAYQAQISRSNNPQRPMAPGMAVRLDNPVTGKSVAFDDCRESDGTMIEAKGPGFAHQLPYQYSETSLVPGWVKQATDQVAAAGGRDVEWYFAEPEAAARAREIFADNQTLRDIRVYHVPADAPQ